MMHAELLHLGERLVVALETMSQDVKNMSSYVYDLSCSVSYLLNEKREKECISVAACDEGADPPSVSSAAEQGASSEGEFLVQYEHAGERFLPPVGDPEHGEVPSAYVASMSFDPHENLNLLSSESNPNFTGRIKVEELAESEVNDESCDVNNMYSSSRNVTGGTASGFRLSEGRRSVAGTSQMESAKHTLMPYVRVHPEERSYKCSVCERSFKTCSELERHSTVHTGERPYKCNVCGKPFLQSSDMTVHMRTHTGECPYKCNICGKSFKKSTNLTVHIRCHTGERPYRCTICGKAFSQATTLKNHVMTHTGEKPYRCTLCGTSFGRLFILNQHMCTHSREQDN